MALAAFGFIKSRFIGISAWKGALQTVLTGGLAATAAFLLASLFE
jgi:VIT1/CCC1 family predicted Fe2+/Mn2+ transporter